MTFLGSMPLCSAASWGEFVPCMRFGPLLFQGMTVASGLPTSATEEHPSVFVVSSLYVLEHHCEVPVEAMSSPS